MWIYKVSDYYRKQILLTKIIFIGSLLIAFLLLGLDFLSSIPFRFISILSFAVFLIFLICYFDFQKKYGSKLYLNTRSIQIYERKNFCVREIGYDKIKRIDVFNVRMNAMRGSFKLEKFIVVSLTDEILQNEFEYRDYYKDKRFIIFNYSEEVKHYLIFQLAKISRDNLD